MKYPYFQLLLLIWLGKGYHKMDIFLVQDKDTRFDAYNISTLLYSVVKGKIYLFGGCSSTNAEHCLPGVYIFDLGE
ncbi:hypothetical protein JD844_009043 [Phrynosoma platyrhinos]|uniref:Uncharacterized protein n=1 Tax=Phrynosoma platyrhinos TaxID=52577 RepID=A0ABQ7TFC3_PHRPL|nr:hypothetical protein JD844_009043 [Phrynosoma platyrhinos]